MITGTYRSGTNRVGEIEGAVQAGVPIGCVVGELSRPARAMLIRYLATGGEVFIDSGEFSNFRKGRETNFTKVFAGYDEIVAAVPASARHRLALVMPDKIGDQATTLDLQTRHAFKILGYMQQGVRVLLPIQRGPLTPRGCYEFLVQMLGTDQFRTALPCKEESWTDAAIVDFLTTVEPAQVHLLGLGKSRRAKALTAQLDTVAPYVNVTTDANFLKAVIGSKRPSSLTNHVRRQVALLEETGVTVTKAMRRQMRVNAYAVYHRTGTVG